MNFKLTKPLSNLPQLIIMTTIQQMAMLIIKHRCIAVEVNRCSFVAQSAVLSLSMRDQMLQKSHVCIAVIFIIQRRVVLSKALFWVRTRARCYFPGLMRLSGPYLAAWAHHRIRFDVHLLNSAQPVLSFLALSRPAYNPNTTPQTFSQTTARERKAFLLAQWPCG